MSSYHDQRMQHLKDKFGIKDGKFAVEEERRNIELPKTTDATKPSSYESSHYDAMRSKYNMPNGLEVVGITKPQKPMDVQEFIETKARESRIETATKLKCSSTVWNGKVTKLWFDISYR